LVGREEELELLLRRWERAQSGKGQVVLLAGEPGIGKSRLIAALEENLQQKPHIRMRYFCSSYHTESAFHPFVQQLVRAAEIQRDDDAGTRLLKLRRCLSSDVTSRDLSLLAELLSIPTETRDPTLDANPQKKKEKTYAALLAQLERLAERTPVLMVFEDLHWIDPTSHELLDQIVRRVSSLKVLLVASYRPEFRSAWSDEAHVTSLILKRLDRREGEALIQHIAGAKLLQQEVVAEIVDRTDGVPLFAEELTKAVLEGSDGGKLMLGQTPRAPTVVPATLQISLMARLDRLGARAKEVAQIGSVIGREFSYEVLAGVTSQPESHVKQALPQLREAGLIFQRGQPPAASYIFKHALVQEAAYLSLLRRTARRYHLLIAEFIEANTPELATTQPEVIAGHFSEAGARLRAARYWYAAGKRAAQRSANIESVSLLRRAQHELLGFEANEEAARLELDVLMALGPALIVTQGFGAPEVRTTFQRAQSLSSKVGKQEDQFPILRGLWNSYLFKGEMLEAQRGADQLMKLADEDGNSALLVEAERVTGTIAFVRGEFTKAQHHLRHGVEIYEPEQHKSLALIYGADPSVSCRGYGTIVEWMLGYPDTARTLISDALELAKELSHGHSESIAVCFRTMLLVCLGEIRAAREAAEATVNIASHYDVRQFRVWPSVYLGWAMTMEGEREHGVSRMEEAISEWRDMGYRYLDPHFSGLLADGLLAAEEPHKAVSVLTQAIASCNSTGESFFLAELNRLMGAAHFKIGDATTAEAYWKQAVDIARAQRARSLELRAATSLALAPNSQPGPMLESVEPLYTSFDQGLETRDLKAARQAIERLRTSLKA
jgi:predicted ATPase